MMRCAFLVSALVALLSAPAGAETRIHLAPTENLERVDVGLLAQAKETIDFAGFIVTDRPVIDALIAAKARGVAVRLLLDHTQRHDLARLLPVLEGAREKPRGPIMHLKAYIIDGRILRTGSANFTASGLKQQNNDLIVTDEAGVVKAFEAEFDRVWEGSESVGDTRGEK